MKIEIKVEKLGKRVMMLTEHFGNGTLGKTEFDASFSIPSKNLIIMVDETRYIVNSQDIISEIVEYHEKNKKKK